MSLLNYTTTIDADKTAGEISKMLAKSGVKGVLTEYNEDYGFVEAISFKIIVNERNIAFKLPCDWRPVLQILKNDKKVPKNKCTREQAVRVSWRIVKDWVEAQLAIIQTQMVRTEEVFLPYMVMKNQKTLSENLQDNPAFLLGDGDN